MFDSSYFVFLYQIKFIDSSTIQVIKDFFRTEGRQDIAKLTISAKDNFKFYLFIDKDNLQHLVHPKAFSFK